ncbi:MAG: hypothetical protein ABI672_01935 [Vicinamibacteria bacterium]
MKRLLPAALVVGVMSLVNVATSEAGGGFEIALFTGPAIPTYKQTFTFSGGSPQVQLARLNVKEAPSLEAKGGISFGAAATLFLSNSFGLEGRIDSVDVDLQSFGGDYTLELGPAGSPVSTVPVTLGVGETDLRRVKPKSLNLRFQSQGRVGIGISGGVSYLSKVELDALPTLTVANLSAAFPVSLTARPVNPDETHHLGFNGGVTLQIKLAKGFAVLAEGRGFAFKRSELKWESAQSGALSVVQQALLANIVSQLEIPAFTPGFWTARAGVEFRF